VTAPTAVNKLRGEAHDARTTDNVSAVLNPLAAAVGATPIMGAAPPSWIRPDPVAGFVQLTSIAVGFGVQQTAYHRDALGYTWLKVALTTAAGSAPNAPLFTLISGYRPEEDTALTAFNGTTGAVSPLGVARSGVVSSLAALGAGESIVGYVSFLAVS